MPICIWRLGRVVSKENGLIPSAGAVVFILFSLFDYRFTLRQSAGLDSYSTLQIGLYSHPLGFLLLNLWAGSYLNEEHSSRKIVSSSILLALTILASFFAAVTAAVFIVAALTVTVGGIIRQKKNSVKSGQATSGKQEPRIFTDATGQRGLSPAIRRIRENPRFRKQVITPIIALMLVSFWLAPMARDYDYFVTRTHPHSGRRLSHAASLVLDCGRGHRLRPLAEAPDTEFLALSASLFDAGRRIAVLAQVEILPYRPACFAFPPLFY